MIDHGSHIVRPQQRKKKDGGATFDRLKKSPRSVRYIARTVQAAVMAGGVAWLEWVRPFGLQENGERGRQQSARENILARG